MDLSIINLKEVMLQIVGSDSVFTPSDFHKMLTTDTDDHQSQRW